MRFTTGNLTRCAGGNHIEIPVTVGGQTETLKFRQGDLAVDFDSREQALDAIIQRMRSAVKEANATTLAQIRAALEGKEFQL